MFVDLPNGSYDNSILQTEPMIAWFTTTEIAIQVWIFKKINVTPHLHSYNSIHNFSRIVKLPMQTIEANTPTIIVFGSLVDDFSDFIKGPPQTKVKITLYGECKQKHVFTFCYNIPKYWAGPIDPFLPNFTFNIFSCFKLLGDYETDKNVYPFSISKFFSEYSQISDLNLLLGDNIYLSGFEANTQSGVIQRYKKLRNVPLLKGAWSSSPFSAICDDHDLGVNDVSFGGPGIYLNRQIFATMWPNNNLNNISPLIWSFFRYDLSFVGIDSRSYCTEPGNPSSTILGQQQLEWLRQTLYSIQQLYENSFIFICTGIPFVQPRDVYFNNGYTTDRNAIIKVILDLNLKNVVFLTGSAHFSNISREPIGNGITITEFMNSPMGTIPRNEKGYEKFPNNPYLVPGTLLLNQNNFGQIKISGNYGKRKLHYSVILQDGTIAYTYDLDQQT